LGGVEDGEKKRVGAKVRRGEGVPMFRRRVLTTKKGGS